VKPTVYLETSVVSYLAAWTSRDLVIAAHQRLTREWWDAERKNFELFVSQAVLDEAGVGDPTAAQLRLHALENVDVLTTPSEALRLAKRVMKVAKLPAKAATDALHIAIAAHHGIGYLLTWNCRHINNAQVTPRFSAACAEIGLVCPKICTPEELLGRSGYEQ
jgi:predicted nucleic acid-binding protein